MSVRKVPDQLNHDMIRSPNSLKIDLLVREFIARENIKRFEAQLTSCTDAEQRETLTRLLEQASRELAEAEAVERQVGL